MNEKEINHRFKLIIDLILSQRLKSALEQLGAELEMLTSWELKDRFEQIQTSYYYMLQYMEQGVVDPEKKKLHRKLLTDTLELTDQARLLRLDPVSARYYHVCRVTHPKEEQLIDRLYRTLEGFNDEIAICDLVSAQNHETLLLRHEETLRTLFFEVWLNSRWTQEEENCCAALLQNPQIRRYDTALLVSAVTISLMECCDPRKVMWLFNAYEQPEKIISQRALAGIALAFHFHAERLALYPEISSRLTLIDETRRFREELNRIYIQFLRCRETEAIDRKMREEIIPEMLKNVSAMRNFTLGFEDIDEEKDDHNPDWEEAFEQSGLSEKMREMSELQMEGADVYMTTFSQLKGYPFFREIQNWFYPFDREHSSVIREFETGSDQENNSILSLILASGFFCNSDKYSLCFTIRHIPQSQRNMMLSQLTEAQMHSLEEEKNTLEIMQISERADVISSQYLHDLYRFFKLHSRRAEFRDPFKETMALHRLPLLKEILCQPELLSAVADFYFRKAHYLEAIETFKELSKLIPADMTLFQKTGYCFQKEKRYEEAIDAYLKADMIRPDSLWTNRHLALCYRMRHSFTQALEYYRKAEKAQPDDSHITFHIGTCLAGLERYDEALNYFFKLDLQENYTPKNGRAIAWCSLMTRKTEQAIKYYDKLINGTPTIADYLNAGHTAWVTGDQQRAITLYRSSLQLCKEKEQFLDLFERDKPVLISLGIPPEDIPLLLDIV